MAVFGTCCTPPPAHVEPAPALPLRIAHHPIRLIHDPPTCGAGWTGTMPGARGAGEAKQQGWKQNRAGSQRGSARGPVGATKKGEEARLNTRCNKFDRGMPGHVDHVVLLGAQHIVGLGVHLAPCRAPGGRISVCRKFRCGDLL